MSATSHRRVPHAGGSAPVIDALGRAVVPAREPRRIVSLVPSLTEALFALGLRDEIVAVTRYCVEPVGLVERVETIGGTKTPDLDAIRRLEPDLVIASAEENVREHVETLIDAGITVYVSLPSTVREAMKELRDLEALTGQTGAADPWLVPAESLVAELAARRPASGMRYFCPIWRRPYMVAGPETYMTDLLHVCGGENVYGPGSARYYPVELAEAMARGPRVVFLPNEPYPFAARHLPEIQAFSDVPAVREGRVHLVDGQLVTWYGPRIATALQTFAALLQESS